MRRSSCVPLLMFLVAVSLVCPSRVRADVELVTNGGFEEGGPDTFTAWMPSSTRTAMRMMTHPHSGSYVFHTSYTGSPSAMTEYYQAVPIAAYAGKTVRVTGYLWADAVVPGLLEVALTDSDACEVASGDRTLIGSVGDFTGRWVTATRDVAIPGATTADYLCLFISGEDNALYFDDISALALEPSRVTLDGVSARAGMQPTLALVLLPLMAGLAYRWLRRKH